MCRCVMRYPTAVLTRILVYVSLQIIYIHVGQSVRLIISSNTLATYRFVYSLRNDVGNQKILALYSLRFSKSTNPTLFCRALQFVTQIQPTSIKYIFSAPRRSSSTSVIKHLKSRAAGRRPRFAKAFLEKRRRGRVRNFIPPLYGHLICSPLCACFAPYYSCDTV